MICIGMHQQPTDLLAFLVGCPCCCVVALLLLLLLLLGTQLVPVLLLFPSNTVATAAAAGQSIAAACSNTCCHSTEGCCFCYCSLDRQLLLQPVPALAITDGAAAAIPQDHQPPACPCQLGFCWPPLPFCRPRRPCCCSLCTCSSC